MDASIQDDPMRKLGIATVLTGCLFAVGAPAHAQASSPAAQATTPVARLLTFDVVSSEITRAQVP